ncbi:MAG: hydroxymethylbilane synthase [Proteobacteria bacterium]|nr:hydroxymethylbilane synthase [Pseudomonadota bacterium]MBU1387442.1 hydroxymethylbilane synthase [Pseudomonadota bacterium]MBU1541727.1 hydroxymethylbilane synthase [Pseudomonadota bacterium]MBU2482933.1 hydroxymethylbilane synthase [Pseudomonadota bacterium]
MKKNIVIGTRGSQLALWQANFIKSEIEKLFPDLTVALNIIKTTGDQITDRPLAMVGGKGLFVKEIETALLNNEIDIAVHSMKDMPGTLPDGLMIGAVPKRENPLDVLISRDKSLLANYKKGAKVGTSSLRRASQIKHLRPDVTIADIRGNLDTRIKKLKSGEYDAIVLAAAGLRRLGLEEEITEYLDESIMTPAVGQGALCIETRKNDADIAMIMQKLNHPDTQVCVTGERAFLKEIEGSCHIPVACFAKIKDNIVSMMAVVASVDGNTMVKEYAISPVDQVEESGRELARLVLEKGGKTILEQLKTHDK